MTIHRNITNTTTVYLCDEQTTNDYHNRTMAHGWARDDGSGVANVSFYTQHTAVSFTFENMSQVADFVRAFENAAYDAIVQMNDATEPTEAGACIACGDYHDACTSDEAGERVCPDCMPTWNG